MKLYEMHGELLAQGEALVRRCPCVDGCPACVGPVLENELATLETKRLTLALLGALQGQSVRAGESQPDRRNSGGLEDDVQF